MRVKRFVGDNVADTMSQIKRELGSEAIILQTRQFKEGGFLGFFANNKVEITAAIEDKPTPIIFEKNTNDKPLVSSDLIKKAYNTYRYKENELDGEKIQEQLITSTHTELREMHNILDEIKGSIINNVERNVFLPSLEKWNEYLYKRGISKEYINRLLGRVKNEISQINIKDDKIIYENIKKQVLEICSKTGTIQVKSSGPLIVALIGPTGVGKTTTIGKLAAGFSIVERKKVALITADTYRVAAVEQLKTFGEIIGVPVEVAMTSEGLEEAIASYADKELIFIDTAGRSPHHDLHMSELKEFLDRAKPDLTMLVMNVTTNINDQMLVFERFKKLSTHLIFTKIDESISTGMLLEIIDRAKLPVAYLTNGQNVPDDIEAATPDNLRYYILGEGILYG
ncbi:MAG: flagellar biosynthesis protein FlhF [Eubacteriales bacterium]